MEGVHQVFNPKKSRFDELFEVEHLAVASQLPTIPIPTMFSQVSGGIPTEKDTCSFCSWASLLAHRLNRCLRILNLTGIFPHLGWEIPKFHMLLRTHLFTCFFCVSKCNDMGAANIQMDFSLSVEFTWSVVKVSVPCYNPHHAPSVNGFVCNLASDGTNKISTTAQFLGKGRRISANLASSIQRKKKPRQFQDIFSHHQSSIWGFRTPRPLWPIMISFKGEGRLVGAYVLNHQHQTKRIGDDEILEWSYMKLT